MKTNIGAWVRTAGKFVQRHQPELLMGFGATLLTAAVAFAIPATVAATRLVDEEKREQNRKLLAEARENGSDTCAQIDKLPAKDVIRVTWKCYIPTVTSTGLGLACLVGATTKNARRATALATACTLSETALKEYQEKVVETIGEAKEHVVRDAIAKDKVEQLPPAANTIHYTGKGTALFLDPHSKRYFEFDVGEVRTVSQNLTDKLRDEMFVSINDLYDEFGLEQTDLGDAWGWDVDKTSKIEIYTSAVKAPDGRPVLVISYNYPPQYDYRHY